LLNKVIFNFSNNWQTKPFFNRKSTGSALVEVLVALGVFVTLAAAGIGAISLTLNSDQMSYDRVRASQLATEGIEATQQIQHSDWNVLTSGTHGLFWSGHGWSLQSSSDQQGKFQRSVAVAIAERDGSGNIVTSGTPDPDTKKITSTASWPASPVRTETITYVTYLTNFFAPIMNNIGNWALPLRHAGINLTSTNDALHMTISGNYLYVTRATGTPNFMILDITDPLAPLVVGSTTLTNNLRQVAIWGDYAYVASTDNTREIQVVNVQTKTAPTFLAFLNQPGNNDAISLKVNNDTLYAGRQGSFLTYSISTPTANNPGLSQLTNFNLGGRNTPVDFDIQNGQFCFATSNASAQIYCGSTASPATATSLTLTGNTAGTTVTRLNNTVFVGLENGNLAAVNISNGPSLISEISQLSTGGAIRSASAITGSKLVLVLSANSAKELQVINTNTPTSMTEYGFFNSASVPLQYNSILYHAPADVAYASFPADAEEITIFKPTPN